jgi:ABC-type lipoprotein export system ATPase subunit
MINLKKLYKYYSNKFQRTFVLKDINQQIQDIEFVLGKGKLCLMEMITCIPMDNYQDC